MLLNISIFIGCLLASAGLLKLGLSKNHFGIVKKNILYVLGAGIIIIIIAHLSSDNNEEDNNDNEINLAEIIGVKNVNYPVKFILCNFDEYGYLNNSKYIKDRLFANLADELKEMQIMDSVFYGYSNKNYDTEIKIKKELEDISGNVVVAYGYTQIQDDTGFISLKYYLKPHSTENFTKNMTLSFIIDNVKKINTSVDQASTLLGLRLSTLYMQYCYDKTGINEEIEFIKQILKRYANLSFAPFKLKEKAQFYGLLANRYNKAGIQDSQSVYASLAYLSDSTFWEARLAKAIALYNYHRDNYDSIKFANDLLDINKIDIENVDEIDLNIKGRILAHVAKFMISDKSFNYGIILADSAIKLDSAYYLGYLVKGICSILKCDDDVGELMFTKALNCDNNQFLSNYYYAVIKTIKGDFETARQYFSKAVRKDILKFSLESRNLKIYPKYCDNPNYDSLIEFTSNIALIYHK